MKPNLAILIVTLGYSLVIDGQDSRIKENISKINETKGVEYFTDGSIKTIINVSKIEYYYHWITTADTISLFDKIASWDISSLKSFYTNYKNENLNFDEQISKCKLIANELKEKYLELKNDSLQLAHLLKH